MTDNFVIAVDGLEALKSIEDLPAAIVRAARQAVNRTTDRARTLNAREIRNQVNFPAQYLSPNGDRLTVVKKASGDDLEGVVRGRSRPTALARFSTGSPGGNAKKGVRLAVKPGSSVVMERAFLFKLRAGGDSIETRNNLGLAIRTPRGRRPDNAYKPVKIADGLWLLFGPSIDQVFRGTARDSAPEVARLLEQEFLRLMEV